MVSTVGKYILNNFNVIVISFIFFKFLYLYNCTSSEICKESITSEPYRSYCYKYEWSWSGRFVFINDMMRFKLNLNLPRLACLL